MLSQICIVRLREKITRSSPKLDNMATLPKTSGLPSHTKARSEADARREELRLQAEEDRIFRDITWMPGFDQSKVTRPCRGDIMTMGEIILWDPISRSCVRDQAPYGVRRIFFAASTVLSMHLDQPEGRDDKPHEQDWFWVFVHDELDSGNSRLKGIAPEFLRQMICFFTQGFGSTSEQLNIAAKGSSCMKSLRTAMAEWCTLTGLQVFDDQPPHIVETSRKRPRQEVQHTNTSAETSSLPTTVSTPGGPDQTNSLKPPQTIVKITQTQRINDLQEELQSMQNKYKELKSEHQALSAKNSSNEKAIQLVRQLARNVESAVPEILDGPGLGRRQTINQKSRASACAYVMIYRQIALSNVLNLRVRAPQWLLSQAEVAESREPANDHSLSEHMRTAANDIGYPQ